MLRGVDALGSAAGVEPARARARARTRRWPGAGSDRLVFCASHAPEGVSDFRHVRCAGLGCSRQGVWVDPAYAAAPRSATYCNRHRHAAMVLRTPRRRHASRGEAGRGNSSSVVGLGEGVLCGAVAGGADIQPPVLQCLAPLASPELRSPHQPAYGPGESRGRRTRRRGEDVHTRMEMAKREGGEMAVGRELGAEDAGRGTSDASCGGKRETLGDTCSVPGVAPLSHDCAGAPLLSGRPLARQRRGAACSGGYEVSCGRLGRRQRSAYEHSSRRQCAHPLGCERVASFGTAGASPRFCVLHRAVHDTYLRRRCEVAGCDARPTYGAGAGSALTHCRRHRSAEHVRRASHLCRAADCQRCPSLLLLSLSPSLPLSLSTSLLLSRVCLYVCVRVHVYMYQYMSMYDTQYI